MSQDTTTAKQIEVLNAIFMVDEMFTGIDKCTKGSKVVRVSLKLSVRNQKKNQNLKKVLPKE